jgi:hypothetical protein
VSDQSLRRWETVGLVSLAVVVLAVPLSLLRPRRELGRDEIVDRPVTFVGSAACRDCHQGEYERWKGSDHERAMDVASEATVLGDFEGAVSEHRGITSRFYRRDGKYFVHTEGPGGTMGEFEVAYVFASNV